MVAPPPVVAMPHSARSWPASMPPSPSPAWSWPSYSPKKPPSSPAPIIDVPPAVLEDKAKKTDLALAGYYDKPLLSRGPADFSPDLQYQTWLLKLTIPPPPAGISSPPFVPACLSSGIAKSKRYMFSRDDIGTITLDEPARDQPGMRTVCLDRSRPVKIPCRFSPTRRYHRPQDADHRRNIPAFSSPPPVWICTTSPLPLPKPCPPCSQINASHWTGSYPEDPKTPVPRPKPPCSVESPSPFLHRRTLDAMKKSKPALPPAKNSPAEASSSTPA